IARVFLAESPYNFVFLGVHKRREQADQLVSEFPHRCKAIALDVTEADSWQKAVKEVLASHERIDVLVNNAGRHSDALLATMPLNAWTEVLRTNLDGAFHGCQAVLRPMVAQRSGRIINIASLSALLAPAGQTNYAAAKAGLV